MFLKILAEKLEKNRIPSSIHPILLFSFQGRKCLSVVFISMENKSTTKATMRKVKFIGSMLASKKYPIDIAEFILELSAEEFTTWNKDKLNKLEYFFFQIPKKRIYQKIELFIETLEVESDGDNQLLTIRFILVGKLNIKEMEDIGIAFRNKTLSEFGGNLYLKLNKQVDFLDFIITISPLQLINYNETSLFPEWVIEKIMTNPLTVVPNSFFLGGLHNEKDTSIM